MPIADALSPAGVHWPRLLPMPTSASQPLRKPTPAYWKRVIPEYSFPLDHATVCHALLA